MNKLRFLKFLKKAETDQKYEEMDLKFEETDQQNEIIKFLFKSGNGSKIWGRGPKIWRNPINTMWFLKFMKKAETDKKYEEIDLKF